MSKVKLPNGATPPGDLLDAMWRYTKGDRALLLLAYVLVIATGGAKLFFPLLVGLMINEIQNWGVSGLDRARPIVTVFFGLLIFLWVVRVPLKMLQFRIARRAQSQMISGLNGHLFSAPLAWHESRHSGDTASRVQQSSSAVFGFTFGQYTHVDSIVQMCGPIVALLILSPSTFVGALIGYAVVAAICVGGDMFQKRYWVRESDAHRAFNTALIEAFRNIMTVYATRRRGPFAEFVETRLRDVFTISRTNAIITEGKWAGIEVIATAFGLVLMVVYMYQQARDGGQASNHIALGNVYMVQAYVGAGMGALLSLVGNLSGFMRQRTDFATAEPIYGIVPEPECLDLLAGNWCALDVQDVAVTYRGADFSAPALKSVDVSLVRGRNYALVGVNGSGKSTLLKLLAGLLHPDAGTLLVDGSPIGFGALRNAATLVPQHPELLQGTLEHNLLIGASDRETALELSGHTVVRTLLERLGVDLDTQVHEGGANWSGGQRQRIALARGLLSAAGSSLVLIDEPTSSIDSADERSIIEGLRAEFEAACLIVSVHNLELVHEFDEVIVLENGLILDSGPVDIVQSRCSYFQPHRRAEGGARREAV